MDWLDQVARDAMMREDEPHRQWPRDDGMIVSFVKTVGELLMLPLVLARPLADAVAIVAVGLRGLYRHARRLIASRRDASRPAGVRAEVE